MTETSPSATTTTAPEANAPPADAAPSRADTRAAAMDRIYERARAILSPEAPSAGAAAAQPATSPAEAAQAPAEAPAEQREERAPPDAAQAAARAQIQRLTSAEQQAREQAQAAADRVKELEAQIAALRDPHEAIKHAGFSDFPDVIDAMKAGKLTPKQKADLAAAKDAAESGEKYAKLDPAVQAMLDEWKADKERAADAAELAEFARRIADPSTGAELISGVEGIEHNVRSLMRQAGVTFEEAVSAINDHVERDAHAILSSEARVRRLLRAEKVRATVIAVLGQTASAEQTKPSPASVNQGDLPERATTSAVVQPGERRKSSLAEVVAKARAQGLLGA